MSWWLLGAALAQEPPESGWGRPTGEIHGDLKSFLVVSAPYENALLQSFGVLPADPTASGIHDARLKLSADWGPLSAEAHHAVTLRTPSAASGLASAGVGLQAPELLDATWVAWENRDPARGDDALTLQGRTDRLWLRWQGGPARVTVGRQPVTLGNGLGFAPLDLVAPFFPTTIDQEYKPGVDAARVDLFFGFSTQITAVAAWAGSDFLPATLDQDDPGDWGTQDMVYALYAQRTFFRNDVGLMFGEIRGDEVFGATLATYAGPVGLTADATYTLPADRDAEDPFFRVATSALWRPGAKTTLTGELYLQTLGTTDPDEYLGQLTGDRYARGELWLAGVLYGSMSVSQEITPLVHANLAVIGNLTDPSALLVPGISWSVSDNVVVSAGGFYGLGARPDELELTDLLDPDTGALYEGDALYEHLGVNSELGFYPSQLFLQSRIYF
ncbi:MAG: hypothetical protein VX899_18485 [Myxococcota bacterium]|nr:hypothetical protein [Myxococcota bacterium]